MAVWPLRGTFPTREVVVQTSTTVVTGSASTHTKGSWTQLVASTAEDISLLHIWYGKTESFNTETSMLLDIGIGSSGNEVVLVGDILSGYRTYYDLSEHAYGRQVFTIPMHVPAGTRISARCQGAVSSDTVDLVVIGYGGASLEGAGMSFGGVTSYGINASTSTGVTLNSTSWIEVTSSTSAQIDAISLIFQGYGSSMNNANNTVDVGVGSSGNEVAVVNNVWYSANTNEVLWTQDPSGSGLIFLDSPIPEGSRLSLKRDGGQFITAAVYGFRR